MEIRLKNEMYLLKFSQRFSTKWESRVVIVHRELTCQRALSILTHAKTEA